MHEMAVLITKDLKFDMAGNLEVLLEQQSIVAEGGTSDTPGGLELLPQCARLPHDSHAFAATPGRGFYKYRVAQRTRRLFKIRIGFEPLRAGDGRHAGLLHAE